jgi:hypothetical protein
MQIALDSSDDALSCYSEVSFDGDENKEKEDVDGRFPFFKTLPPPQLPPMRESRWNATISNTTIDYPPSTILFTGRDNGLPNWPVVLYGTFHVEHQSNPLNVVRSPLLLLVVHDHNDGLVHTFIVTAAIIAATRRTTQYLCIVSLTFWMPLSTLSMTRPICTTSG